MGSLGFIFFFFLFSFLFFFLFFYFRRFRADYFLVFLLSLYFLDLDVIVLAEAKCRIQFLFKLLPGMLEVQTNFWNSIVSVSNCSFSYDQRNVVSCNSVIEEPSFH